MRILFINQYFPPVGLAGLLAARRYRRPLVQISQDVYPDIAVGLGRDDDDARRAGARRRDTSERLIAEAAAIRSMRGADLDAAGQRALAAFGDHYTRERATAATRTHLDAVVRR